MAVGLVMKLLAAVGDECGLVSRVGCSGWRLVSKRTSIKQLQERVKNELHSHRSSALAGMSVLHEANGRNTVLSSA